MWWPFGRVVRNLKEMGCIMTSYPVVVVPQHRCTAVTVLVLGCEHGRGRGHVTATSKGLQEAARSTPYEGPRRVC